SRSRRRRSRAPAPRSSGQPPAAPDSGLRGTSPASWRPPSDRSGALARPLRRRLGPGPGRGSSGLLLLRDAELHLAGADARFVAGLREDGGAALDLARLQVEAGRVPRADDGVALALALVQRAAEVRACVRDRAHFTGLRGTRDEHVLA